MYTVKEIQALLQPISTYKQTGEVLNITIDTTNARNILITLPAANTLEEQVRLTNSVIYITSILEENVKPYRVDATLLSGNTIGIHVYL